MGVNIMKHLFFEDRQIVEHISTAKNAITEEHGFLNAFPNPAISTHRSRING